MNQVSIDFRDPCAFIVTPADMVPHDILRVQMYGVCLNAIVKQPAKFTDGMECAICHKKHIFANCPTLKDIDYLQKHFISYCIIMNYTKK